MSTLFLRRFSRRFIIPRIRGRITPNQVTALRLLTGLASCALIAWDPNRWALIAGGGWLLSTYLDRLDGELARVCGTASAWGRFWDYLADMICTVGFFIAAGIGLSSPWAPFLGLLAGAGVGTAILLSEIIENGGTAKAWEGAGIFDLDDSVFLFPLFLWFGVLEWLLIGGAIGGTLFAILTAIKWRRGPQSY